MGLLAQAVAKTGNWEGFTVSTILSSESKAAGAFPAAW